MSAPEARGSARPSDGGNERESNDDLRAPSRFLCPVALNRAPVDLINSSAELEGARQSRQT